jgi:polyhydroxyalkanoate synthesis repressor PhaR
MGEREPRIIKKYPNRRLYDTGQSRYITLADVRELVSQGVDFVVLDANTEEDITRMILLQIILEQESGDEPLFTTDILAKMIRFYGDSMQGVFTDYLGKSLNLFVEQQTRLQQQIQEMVTRNPIDLMAEVTKRNMELWQEMQDSFLRASGLGSGTGKTGPRRGNKPD